YLDTGRRWWLTPGWTCSKARSTSSCCAPSSGGRCTATPCRVGFMSVHAACSPWSTRRCTRRCTGWRAPAVLAASGAFRRTGDARVTTGSRLEVARGSSHRTLTGASTRLPCFAGWTRYDAPSERSASGLPLSLAPAETERARYRRGAHVPPRDALRRAHAERDVARRGASRRRTRDGRHRRRARRDRRRRSKHAREPTAATLRAAARPRSGAHPAASSRRAWLCSRRRVDARPRARRVRADVQHRRGGAVRPAAVRRCRPRADGVAVHSVAAGWRPPRADRRPTVRRDAYRRELVRVARWLPRASAQSRD